MARSHVLAPAPRITETSLAASTPHDSIKTRRRLRVVLEQDFQVRQIPTAAEAVAVAVVEAAVAVVEAAVAVVEAAVAVVEAEAEAEAEAVEDLDAHLPRTTC
jgi:hypothetical protein